MIDPYRDPTVIERVLGETSVWAVVPLALP